MIGKKFGKLTVLEELPERKHGKIIYQCKCDCGNITNVLGCHLRNGNTKSCGCLKYEHKIIKHGKCNTRLYRQWKNMKQRCYNKNYDRYKDYGARGINICDEWLHDFQAFYDWAMNNGYNDNLTIDRIDNNKGYSQDNCRWVDIKTQCNNTRRNVFITYDGKTQTIAQWGHELNIDVDKISARHRAGWSDKECLFGKEV